MTKAQPNWPKLTQDVMARIEKIHLAWTAKQQALPDGLMDEEFYDALLHLAMFCNAVDDLVQVEEVEE